MEFTRIKNDVNGNPRYVVHFLALLTGEEMDNYHAEYGIRAISEAYAEAVKRSHAIGGRKYHNKQYGGGIVFQSYSTDELAADIEQLKVRANRGEEYQGWTNSRTWCAALYLQQEREAYEAITDLRKQGKRVLASDISHWFRRLNLHCDDWTKGKINWVEIAQSYNDEDY